MAQDQAPKVTDLQQLRQERQRLAHRARRIIFNNDGNEPVYECKEATPEALLACRTTPLLGSQVDSIFYCTWSSAFSYFTHNTKVGTVFDRTDNPTHPDNTDGGLSRNKTADFIRQGTDPLKIMVDFCKKNHIEVFWSFRMNDTHDAWGSWYGDLLFPPLKQQHPDWMVGSKEKRVKHGGWSAMDFGRPEVRDLAVRFIEEVCQNYDVDGIEMDFCRHGLYFKGPANGIDAGAEELAQMTDMVRQVREVTEREGLRRGRPILVGIRVPDSVAFCKAMGLDVERWLADGLVDLMAVSDYFRLNEWPVSIALGHRYNVPVYPCLSETRLTDKEAARARSSNDCYRGRALNAWADGADGIYMFNSFNPRSALWRELGDPKKLAGLDAAYFAGVRGAAVINWWMEDGERRFLKRTVLTPERPAALKPGAPATLPLEVGDAPREPLEVTLKLRVKELPDAAELSVTVNGHALPVPAAAANWLNYAVGPAWVKKGVNQVELSLKAEGAGRPVVEDLQLWVKRRKAS